MKDFNKDKKKEHETLNLRVVGSSPTLGECFFFLLLLSFKFND